MAQFPPSPDDEKPLFRLNDAERIAMMPKQEILWVTRSKEARAELYRDYYEGGKRLLFLRELCRNHWRELMENNFSLQDLRGLILYGEKPYPPDFSIHHKHPGKGGGTNDIGNLIFLPGSLHNAIHLHQDQHNGVHQIRDGESKKVQLRMPAGMFALQPEDRLQKLSPAEREKQMAGKPETPADWAKAEQAVAQIFVEAALQKALPLPPQFPSKRSRRKSRPMQKEQIMSNTATTEKPILTQRVLCGSDAIGANCHEFSYGNSRILVDAGTKFEHRNDASPFDLVMADLTRNGGMSRYDAVILTHIHEDHIGGIPYLAAMGQKLPPIYCDPITGELLKIKVEDMLKQMRDPRAKHIDKLLDIRLLKDGKALSFGGMTVEPISMAHSAAFTHALAISAGGGKPVIHLADFNGKKSVPVGPGTNYKRLAELGESGVLAVLVDSTRADQPGRAIDERIVRDKLTELVAARGKRRIIATCFASSLHRIHSLMVIAHQTNRTMVIEGRSIETMLRAARRAGFDPAKHIAKGTPFILSGKQASLLGLEPFQQLVVMTGNQAEPNAALPRAALGSHPRIELGKNDTVLMTSSKIPGNEEAIDFMISVIRDAGADVITTVEEPALHAGGHAKQDDILDVVSVLKPLYAVPIHGDAAKRAANENLLLPLGIKTIAANNGAVIAYEDNKATLLRHEPVHMLGIRNVTDQGGNLIKLAQTPYVADRPPESNWETFTEGVIPMRPTNRIAPPPPPAAPPPV